ncbi:MAG: MBL fold metallo-hydrolase [Lewinellaceae bacterium]|nr:MBL fold metallo-hydrolase [Saprospiraceae bacterium]MCB9339264.1 MBL fold metallo-hydrolase [Lewinellaceae bacterium]
MIQFKDKQATIFESSLFRTTATVVETPDLVLVVDPNWLPLEVEAIRQFVASVRKEKPLYLLFTHSDYDHIIGGNAFPEARAIASGAFVENPDHQSIVEQILQFDDDYYIQRDYGIAYPKVDVVVERDGQTLAIGNTLLTFYLAPGHNRDGIFTLLEDKTKPATGAVWLAGDYLCNVEFPYIYYSSVAYENTLEKVGTILAAHKVRLMVPGHGDVATDQEEILHRTQSALDYLRQLRQHVERGDPFDLKKLWEQYHFPRVMKKFHEGNMALLTKEFQSGSTGKAIPANQP